MSTATVVRVFIAIAVFGLGLLIAASVVAVIGLPSGRAVASGFDVRRGEERASR